MLYFLAVREDAQHISPAKPIASSRISGAWKKVCIISKNSKNVFNRNHLEW